MIPLFLNIGWAACREACFWWCSWSRQTCIEWRCPYKFLKKFFMCLAVTSPRLPEILINFNTSCFQKPSSYMVQIKCSMGNILSFAGCLMLILWLKASEAGRLSFLMLGRLLFPGPGPWHSWDCSPERWKTGSWGSAADWFWMKAPNKHIVILFSMEWLQHLGDGCTPSSWACGPVPLLI